MSPLRDTVRKLGANATELVELLETLSDRPDLQPILLASLAYAPGYSVDTARAISTVVRSQCPASDIDRGTTKHTEAVRACYAGLFSLHMRGVVSEREPLIEDLVSLHLINPAAGATLRDLATFAISDLNGQLGGVGLKCLDSAREAQPEMYFTTEVRRALCRAGGADVALRIVHDAGQGDGHSREGLESASNPVLVPELQAMVARRPLVGQQEAYANALARSAARGLLSIDAELGSGEFRRLLLSDDERVLVSARDALGKGVPVTAAAQLSLASIDVAGKSHLGSIASSIGVTLDLIRDRCSRMTVSDHDRMLCAQHVWESLPALRTHVEPARRALEILALVDDDIGVDALESAMDGAGIPEDGRATIRSGWKIRHGIQ